MNNFKEKIAGRWNAFHWTHKCLYNEKPWINKMFVGRKDMQKAFSNTPFSPSVEVLRKKWKQKNENYT